MIINPMIPIPIMATICAVLLLLKRRGIWPYIRQILLVGFLFLINLRISIPDGEQTVTIEKLQAYIVLAIDNTLSMQGNDYIDNRTRMSGVKGHCNYIVDQLTGVKFAVLSFDNEAHILSPFSDDGTFVKNLIGSMKPLQHVYATGTSLNTSHDQLLTLTQLAAEQKDGPVFVIYFSDGEMTAEKDLESFEDIAPYIDGGAVLGYGTKEGGNMQIHNYQGEPEWLMDPESLDDRPAVTKLDEENLKDIARDLEVPYYHITRASDLDELLEQIKEGLESESMERTEEMHRETYYWFVIPMLLLLLYEFVDLKRRV